ncbi:trypsin-like protease, partial [Pavlovales sp. CCMP2436]
YELPWQSHPPESSTGSGLVICEQGKNMILTNAHVVADATLIEVRKSGSARRFVARAYAVAHECDLALLEIDDPDFWKRISPLELGDVPHLRDAVDVVGYPEGGDSLCVTSGVVSRIELQTYEHSGQNLLSLQIDAAINPGNSGGPAFDRSGRVVGVAFQNAPESQSIGFVIPTPVIRHFL